MIFNNATFNRVGRNTYNREHAPWRQIFNLSFLDQFKPRHFSNKRFTIRGENVPPMKLLFLPRPGKESSNICQSSRSLREKNFPEFQGIQSSPSSHFFFSLLSTSGHRRQRRQERGGEVARDSNSRLKGARIVPAGRFEIQWKLICRA